MTPFLLMLGLVVAMVAPGVAMRVSFLRSTRDETGQADGATLASVLGWVVLALVAVWVARHVGASHAGEVCSCALVWPGMRLPNPYRYGPNWGWTVISADEEDNSCSIRWEDGSETSGAIVPVTGRSETAIQSALMRRSWQVESARADGRDQYSAPIGPDLPRLGTERSALGMAIGAVGGHLEDLAGGFVGVSAGPVLVTVDESAYELLPRWAEWVGADSLWLDDPALYLVGGMDDQDYQPVPCSLSDLPAVVDRVYRELTTGS